MDAPNDTSLKRCSRGDNCLQSGGPWLPLIEFSRDKSRPDRLQRYCKACVREQKHQYYVEHRQERAERSLKWRAEHPQMVAEQNRRYRALHPEQEMQRRRVYDAEHKTEKSERDQRYRITHPEVQTAKRHRHRALIAGADGSFTASDLLVQIAAQTDEEGVLHCYWCLESIPDGGYHIDHRTPLVRGGSNGPENIVVSCPACNMSKHDKLPSEWAGRLK